MTTKKLSTVAVTMLASLLLMSGTAHGATPTVTIEPACGAIPAFPDTNVARVNLSGFPPVTTVQATLELPNGFTFGPGEVTTDADGNWDQEQLGLVGSHVPGTWTVTIVWSGGTLTDSVYVDCSRPTSKADCKRGGWRDFPEFKNQGQCIAFVNHGP
jgi:hypothetical protein